MHKGEKMKKNGGEGLADGAQEEEGGRGKNGEGEESAGEKGSSPQEAIAELSDKLLRLQAEFDNYQKRVEKEKRLIAQDAEARMMLRLLPIYEELGLAEQEAQKIADEAVRKGMLLVLGKLRAAFKSEGLEEISAAGEKFDPFLHEAALRVHSQEPEGKVLEVVKKGYLFKGKLLRHAVVSVSAGGKKEAKGGESNGNLCDNQAGSR